MERFGDVVICTGFEPFKPVSHLALRSEEQHRWSTGCSDALAEFNSGDARQHDVCDHQVDIVSFQDA